MSDRVLRVKIVGDEHDLLRSFKNSSSGARTFERDIGKASRGALAGSGAFRSMGRSLAFASGSFLGVASVAEVLRASIDAAEEFGKASRGLSAQLKANGQAASAFSPLIERTNAAMAKFGITASDSELALTRLARATGDVSKGAKLMALTANLAAARHIALSQSALIVGKVVQGTTTAFNRYGLVLKHGTSVQEALRIATAKFAGQAAAATTPLAKLHAGVNLLEIAVGQALLPTVEKIAVALTNWVSNSDNVARVQRDVRDAVKVATAAFNAARAVIGPLVSAFQKLAGAVGGTTHAFEILFALGIASKLNRISLALGGAGLAGGAAGAAGAFKALGFAAFAVKYTFVTAGLRGLAAGAAGLSVSVASLSTAMRVGLAGAVIFAGFQLSKLIRQIPGVESASRSLGSSLEDLLSKQKGARLVLGIQGAPDAAPTADAFKAVGQAVKLIQRGISERRIEATLKLRFHLNQHDFDVLFADARRRLAAGLSQSQAVAGSPGRDPGRFQTSAAAAADPRRRRPTSLQGLFNLDELRLADAQRTANVKAQRAILVDEERLTLKLRDQAKTLKDRTKFAQQAAQLEDQIRSIDQQAASDAKTRRDAAAAARKKAAEAARKAAELARSFAVPLTAQLAEAKAAATKSTADDLSAARAIKALAQKALKSGRLGLQGQIDAWNAITTENQTIADLLKKQAKETTTAFKKANLDKLLSGLGLTADQFRAARARLSQVGPGGTVPGSGSGAFGFALAGGGTTVVHTQVNLDGRKVASNTTRHQQRRDRRNPPQKRGPHAR